MNRKGINYDTGTPTTHNTSSRPTFDPQTVELEMKVIKNDLHCTSIRISGIDLSRLTLAAKYAFEQGLEVFFSPSLHDLSQAQALVYFSQSAEAAEHLRQINPNIVLVTGVELTAFMSGFLEGDTPMQRLSTLMNPFKLIKSTIFKGSYHKNLNTFLARATTTVRQHFKGPLTYASGPWEEVDWQLFDFVGVDYYRDAMNKLVYQKNLRAYFKPGKPVIITEFGCCTYQGAADKGGYGWAIVDWTKSPPQLKRDFVRDESGQARYLTDLLQVFEAEQVDGAFVFTFVSPSYPYNENPAYDLDMASYSLVKSYPDRTGIAYPHLPWEPKESFHKLANYYSAH
jgi:hypothetical protein